MKDNSELLFIKEDLNKQIDLYSESNNDLLS